MLLNALRMPLVPFEPDGMTFSAETFRLTNALFRVARCFSDGEASASKPPASFLSAIFTEMYGDKEEVVDADAALPAIDRVLALLFASNDTTRSEDLPTPPCAALARTHALILGTAVDAFCTQLFGSAIPLDTCRQFMKMVVSMMTPELRDTAQGMVVRIERGGWDSPDDEALFRSTGQQLLYWMEPMILHVLNKPTTDPAVSHGVAYMRRFQSRFGVSALEELLLLRPTAEDMAAAWACARNSAALFCT